MRRIAIVGSRDYPDMGQVRDFVLSLSPDTVVVSGGARGVDTVAERAANEIGLETVIFHADWDTYGKSAGYIRNKELVRYADEVVAFWDGQSKGTRHTVTLAEHVGKPLIIVGPGESSLPSR